MPRGDAENFPAGNDSGAADGSALYAARKEKSRFAHIADASKACVKEQPDLIDAADQLISEKSAVCKRSRVLVAGQMCVHVDETGKDASALAAVPCSSLRIRAVFRRTGIDDLVPFN